MSTILAFDCIEQIYRANEIYLAGERSKSAFQERLDYQHQALTSVKLTGYIALLAREQGAILPKQYEQISKQAPRSTVTERGSHPKGCTYIWGYG